MTPVLVVDDSESIRKLVQAMLAEENCTVREAEDGEQGLAELRSASEPNVVLLDYRMPKLDGFELLQRAAKDGDLLSKHEYIIITSEVGTFPEAFIDLVRRLSIRVLPKPFAKEALVSSVTLAAERLSASSESAFPTVAEE